MPVGDTRTGRIGGSILPRDYYLRPAHWMDLWRIGVRPRGALRILTKHIVRNRLERWEVDNPGGTRMHDASMHPASMHPAS